MEISMYKKLLQLPLFQGLGDKELTQILEKVRLRFQKYDAGAKIVKQGAECNKLIFILNGTIQSHAENEEHSYAFEETFECPFVIEPYSLFGMHTTFTASYTAVTDVDVLIIDKSYVLTYLNLFEIFQLNYLNILSNRAQLVYKRLWNTHSTDTKEKIINFLRLRASNNVGKKVLYIKMEVLAELIDDTRISVSKALNELDEHGLVILSRKTIHIPDMMKLIESTQK